MRNPALLKRLVLLTFDLKNGKFYDLAERQGFEPWDPFTGVNGFRDRPIRPLWHLSGQFSILFDIALPDRYQDERQ
jgi:hypothetical protein